MWAQIALVLATLYFLYQLIKPTRPPNFPPGPGAYPIVGSIPEIMKLDKTINGAMKKMGEVYGPVCSAFFGKNRAIIVTGWEAVKQVLSRDEFSGRPPLFFTMHPELKMPLGMLFVTNNELYRTQRRFTLRRLRDWGFGKTTLEGLIHEEIEETFVQLEKKAGENEGVVSIADAFGIPVINILWAVVAGKRFKHEDEKIKELLRRIFDSFRAQNFKDSIIGDYPFLRHLPVFASSYRALMSTRAKTEKFVEDAIDEHLKTRDPANPRDFLDEYLNELEKEKNNRNTTFFREQLVATTLDIFNAGAESTTNTVAFALLYMILHPEVQEKVVAEIDAIVGKDRLPNYEDRTKMPYTEAVMTELMRITPIAAQAVPHYTMEDTTLSGYSIPKDTFVVVSIESVNMDPKIYGDPETFRPERFLQEGKFVKREEFIPFGIGKRACIGESLARMNYFLIFTSMLQRYRFEVVPGESLPSTVPITGFTNAPQPFSAKLTPRAQ